MRQDTLSIKLPEGIMFSQPLAGPVTRFFAWIMDALCILAIMIGANQLLSLVAVLSVNLATALRIFAWFAISMGYGMTLEWFWRGQTVGKRLLRLRVVDAEGLHLQFNQVAIRNLLRFVDSLPVFYLIGGASCWLNSKCQRLGDIAGNTVVIREPRIDEPDLSRALGDKYNSLRRWPHLAARLRQRVSPAEASVALQALLRRDEFEPSSRVQLFAELAAHFRSKVEFPAEGVEGVADEQYVRNILDLLFTSEGSVRRQPA